MFDIELYKTESGNTPVEEYIDSVRKKDNTNGKKVAVIIEYVEMLEQYGYEINKKFKPMATKPLANGIYELRPDNHRILFFHYDDNKNCYVLLHGFTKKRQKTPQNEIKKAIREKDDYIRRNGNE